MNVETFHGKSLDQRAAIVRHKGIFLTSCDWLSYGSSLFHLQDFFAEVWHAKESKEIFLIRGFTVLSGLRPYLNLIDLRSIQPLLN